ncbi:Lateral signaling target protein 2 [Galemys pyrenaicus]|uniref:Lateral signaling target protein 2 homolog n=1 Tax=Galemys pyrenaicus TaxID=202257 RepID=A0A8J6AC46_GALPY|nr:Lateral signaling target protein 2 [Galemys pyrenaicus]
MLPSLPTLSPHGPGQAGPQAPPAVSSGGAGGLVVYADGPLNLDRKSEDMSELFRPFHSLLRKIRAGPEGRGPEAQAGRLAARDKRASLSVCAGSATRSTCCSPEPALDRGPWWHPPCHAALAGGCRPVGWAADRPGALGAAARGGQRGSGLTRVSACRDLLQTLTEEELRTLEHSLCVSQDAGLPARADARAPPARAPASPAPLPPEEPLPATAGRPEAELACSMQYDHQELEQLSRLVHRAGDEMSSLLSPPSAGQSPAHRPAAEGSGEEEGAVFFMDDVEGAVQSPGGPSGWAGSTSPLDSGRGGEHGQAGAGQPAAAKEGDLSGNNNVQDHRLGAAGPAGPNSCSCLHGRPRLDVWEADADDAGAAEVIAHRTGGMKLSATVIFNPKSPTSLDSALTTQDAPGHGESLPAAEGTEDGAHRLGAAATSCLLNSCVCCGGCGGGRGDPAEHPRGRAGRGGVLGPAKASTKGPAARLEEALPAGALAALPALPPEEPPDTSSKCLAQPSGPQVDAADGWPGGGSARQQEPEPTAGEDEGRPRAVAGEQPPGPPGARRQPVMPALSGAFSRRVDTRRCPFVVPQASLAATDTAAGPRVQCRPARPLRAGPSSGQRCGGQAFGPGLGQSCSGCGEPCGPCPINDQPGPEAGPAAAREKIRARFHGSHDLIHRLFVCISGVADQLQTNYASDLRTILKTLFEAMATKPEADDEGKLTKVTQTLRSAALEDCALCQETLASSEPAAKTRDGDLEDPPEWVPDEACGFCTACRAPFTVIRRKHHCRSCGKIFCSRCSSHSAPLPRYGQVKPVRVCTHCYMFHVTPFYSDKAV